MTPGLVNFICPQGATFKRTMLYTADDMPFDLSGYSAKLQVRENYYSVDPLITLATSGSGIELTGTSGSINLYIAHEDTQNLPVGTHVYDLKLTNPSSEDDRLIEGDWIVTPGVTR